MSEKDEIKQFHESHPWPEASGINSLYRFAKIDSKNIEFLRQLFVDKKLYLSLPSQFNDPFECKPHFNWPSRPNKARDIRKHLIKTARERGSSKKDAEAMVAESISKPGFIEESIYRAILSTFQEMRICSFTKAKENLLFWSHYADSHRGFCLEYDATLLPIKYAFKVLYKDEYPEVEYPRPSDARGVAPALIKSSAWTYEDEYRIIYMPEAEGQPAGDGKSLFLEDGAIKNIYFGSKIAESNKEIVLRLLEDGPFNPGIWQAKLSKSSFELEFFNESSSNA